MAAGPVTETPDSTILVVEDDPGIATLERRRLERAGYATVTAATAEAALARVAAGGSDLIVLDYSLPGGITGLELHARLQAAGHDLPVIMVTGQSSEAVVIQALRLGIHDFVTDSVEYLDYLPEAVGRVLAQVRTARRLEEREEQFRATFEQAAVGIAHVGLDGRWLLVNQRLCDIVGYPRDELLARRYQELTHPDDLAADLEQHRRLLGGEMATYALEKRY